MPKGLVILGFTIILNTLNACAYQKNNANSSNKACDQARQFTFSWTFIEDCHMRPRGGSTKGAEVQLLKQPTPGWLAIQEPGLSNKEKDRRAILAMTGVFRTSFDFIETVGFVPSFKPDRPYQSWGTETIFPIENRENFISLQHVVVMYFR